MYDVPVQTAEVKNHAPQFGARLGCSGTLGPPQSPLALWGKEGQRYEPKFLKNFHVKIYMKNTVANDCRMIAFDSINNK